MSEKLGLGDQIEAAGRLWTISSIRHCQNMTGAHYTLGLRNAGVRLASEPPVPVVTFGMMIMASALGVASEASGFVVVDLDTYVTLTAEGSVEWGGAIQLKGELQAERERLDAQAHREAVEGSIKIARRALEEDMP